MVNFSIQNALIIINRWKSLHLRLLFVTLSTIIVAVDCYIIRIRERENSLLLVLLFIKNNITILFISLTNVFSVILVAHSLFF